MAFWTNPWLVGIGASTASGLIVWFLTSFLFRKKDDAHYRRQVEAANEHLVNSLRPAISEDSLPDVLVIASLRAANSRKFHVREEDVWPVDAILDELIREVMDSSFIGERVKKSYTHQLVTAKNSYFNQLRLREEQEQSASVNVESKENSAWSAIFTVLAMGGTAAIVAKFTDAGTWGVVLAAVIAPTAFVILAAIVFVFVSNLGAKSRENEPDTSATADKS